jgi:hypothetical protein
MCMYIYELDCECMVYIVDLCLILLKWFYDTFTGTATRAASL